MKKNLLLILSLFVIIQVFAQSVRPVETEKQIVIETKHSALVYSVGKNKKLRWNCFFLKIKCCSTAMLPPRQSF